LETTTSFGGSWWLIAAYLLGLCGYFPPFEPFPNKFICPNHRDRRDDGTSETVDVPSPLCLLRFDAPTDGAAKAVARELDDAERVDDAETDRKGAASRIVLTHGAVVPAASASSSS
jgi:hypothetical protein